MSMESNKIPKEYSNEQEEEKKEFSFLQETIKSEQMTGRKLASPERLWRLAGLFSVYVTCGFLCVKTMGGIDFSSKYKQSYHSKRQGRRKSRQKKQSRLRQTFPR